MIQKRTKYKNYSKNIGSLNIWYFLLYDFTKTLEKSKKQWQ